MNFCILETLIYIFKTIKMINICGYTKSNNPVNFVITSSFPLLL